MILTRKQLNELIMRELLFEETAIVTLDTMGLRALREGSAASYAVANSLVVSGLLDEQLKGKAEYIVDKLEDKADSMITSATWGTAATRAAVVLDICWIIALYHTEGPEAAAKHAATTIPIGIATVEVASVLSSGLGVTGGAMLVAAIGIPTLFFYSLNDIDDPFVAIEKAFKHSTNAPEQGSSKRYALEIGKQIDYPSDKARGIGGKVGAPTNPWLGLQIYVKETGNHSKVRQLKEDNKITQKAYDWVMRPTVIEREYNKFLKYAEALIDNIDDEDFEDVDMEKATRVMERFYSDIRGILWNTSTGKRRPVKSGHKATATTVDDYGFKRTSDVEGAINDDSYKQFRELVDAYAEKMKGLKLSPPKARVMIDRKFVSKGFQGKGAGRKKGLGGNPPGVGSYLYWLAAVSEKDPLSTGLHTYFNKVLPRTAG